MIGGLAQLVERLLCKQDVSGSSPLTSMDSDGGVVIRERNWRPQPRWYRCAEEQIEGTNDAGLSNEFSRTLTTA